MQKSSSIAVLMPSYNPGEGIHMTLNSLRSQSVPFKLFVVDDGSPAKPDYRKLLQGFDYHLIELPNNVGVNEVRNPGLAQILREGFDYVALIDCGDAMTPRRLALQKTYLDENPEIDIVGSWIEMNYEETGRKFDIHWPIDSDEITRGLWVNMSVTHPALMLRSAVFKTVGFYTGSFEAAEDYDFLRRAMKAGCRFHNIDEKLLIKYETKDSISWRKRRAQLKSRLRIQWRYRNLTNPLCIAGLLKTAAILVVPDRLAPSIKAVIGQR